VSVGGVQCTNIVDEYGQMIAHLIATEYTPKQVCQVHTFVIVSLVVYAVVTVVDDGVLAVFVDCV